jgi:hypothetical protein
MCLPVLCATWLCGGNSPGLTYFHALRQLRWRNRSHRTHVLFPLPFCSGGFALDLSQVSTLDVMTPTFGGPSDGSAVDVEAFLLDDADTDAAKPDDDSDALAGLPSVTVVKGEEDEDDE